jgi:hypothetical protein
MPFVVVAAQFLLAAVFAVSAIAKVRDGRAFRRYVAALRLPVRLSTVGTVASELVVAGLLLVPAAAPIGFALTLGLLGVFSLALDRGRRLDVRVPCGCFGPTPGGAVGNGGLVRNGVLAIVAAAGFTGSIATAPATLSSGFVATSALGVAAAIVVVRFDDLRKGLR